MIRFNRRMVRLLFLRRLRVGAFWVPFKSKRDMRRTRGKRSRAAMVFRENKCQEANPKDRSAYDPEPENDSD